MRRMQQADLRRVDPETSFKILFGVLKKLRESLQSREISLMMVIIPSREEVASGYSKVSDRIMEHCRTESMNCLSLIDSFRQEPESGSKLYFREDMHWTREGHRAAARNIFGYLHSMRQQTSSFKPMPAAATQSRTIQ